MTPTAEGKTHVDAQLSQILELGLELSRQHARAADRLRSAFQNADGVLSRRSTGEKAKAERLEVVGLYSDGYSKSAQG